MKGIAGSSLTLLFATHELILCATGIITHRPEKREPGIIVIGLSDLYIGKGEIESYMGIGVFYLKILSGNMYYTI